MEIIPPRLKEPLYKLYEMRLRQELAKASKPRHIAVLCDGNRRWARSAGYTDVSHGYRMGARKIGEMLGWCQDAGVEMATVYLLSAENLTRDPDQLGELLEIITDVVEELCAPQNRWSVRSVGDLDLLPDEVAERMRQAVKSAPADAAFHVNVAVGYGGRQEITDAVRTLLNKELSNGASAEQLVQAVTVDAISENLYTSGQPDPDLVIRTSGEQRLSGFLLWQSAYSEMWFTDAYWPEFRRVDFLRALRDYAARNRRFGQ
ncbi:isoprenyl transferase [Mycobacterium sp. D16R24]|uniref:isoprenyl transferase n=1 Tax=Mycobacterium sp. D16R24 TaxID=1855656 RepID=UPI0009944C46|nr:isoprenyl transferase [Mycobacterium sp. D16R24]